jgi:hypothetical protein
MTLTPAVDLDVFGRVLAGSDVEEAAKLHLQKWFGTYLAFMERQKNLTAGSLARPRSWITTNEFDKFPEAQMPCVLIISPGLVGEPTKGGGHGRYRAKWALATAVIVSAATRAEADQYAKWYAACLRAVMIQKPSMDGFAIGNEWLGESYDDISFESARAQAAGKNLFSVLVDDVTTKNLGPNVVNDPDTTPYVPVNTADTVTNTIEVEQL